MALFNSKVVMTTTMADYVNLINCKETITDIMERMNKEGTDVLENVDTGEIIEMKDLKHVINISF